MKDPNDLRGLLLVNAEQLVREVPREQFPNGSLCKKKLLPMENVVEEFFLSKWLVKMRSKVGQIRSWSEFEGQQKLWRIERCTMLIQLI